MVTRSVAQFLVVLVSAILSIQGRCGRAAQPHIEPKPENLSGARQSPGAIISIGAVCGYGGVAHVRRIGNARSRISVEPES